MESTFSMILLLVYTILMYMHIYFCFNLLTYYNPCCIVEHNIRIDCGNETLQNNYCDRKNATHVKFSKYPKLERKIAIPKAGNFTSLPCTMASQQQDQQGVSPFPTPPSVFYKHYTDERVKSGQVPKPPAPLKGTYTMFGAPFNVWQSSSSSLIPRPSHVFQRGTWKMQRLKNMGWSGYEANLLMIYVYREYDHVQWVKIDIFLHADRRCYDSVVGGSADKTSLPSRLW